MKTTFLYTLSCPTTGAIRYLGKSDNPFKRFKQHIWDADRRKSHKNNWILSLRAQGLKPWMELLDEVPVTEWQFWEREYVRVFRAIGLKLTNLTAGGEGRNGDKVSSATRLKMSIAHSGDKNSFFGKHHSLETRERLRRSNEGKCLSGVTKEKIGISGIGRRHSPEARAKIGAAHLGKPLSSEHRVKLSVSHLGKSWSTSRRGSFDKRKLTKQNDI